jgi:cytoskeleton protein RodZ
MQATPTDHQLSAARVALGAGAMLKHAREAAGLSATDIAARTRLEVRVINALENEDYASLAAGAFVKGYIRSIARELGIDPLPLLARFTEQIHHEDPALADFTTRSPIQITSSSTVIRAISVALGVVVLILIALWWQRNYQAGSQSADALAELAAQNAAAKSDPGTPLPYTYTIVEHSERPLTAVNSWRHQTDGSAPPAVPESTPAAPPEISAPPDPHTPAPQAAPAATTSTTGELLLDGRGESWIEVSDVAGKRLFFGLLKPGQRVGVTGTPPYDLVIGNSGAVAATFRGAAIDVKARAINGVARFSLGEPR